MDKLLYADQLAAELEISPNLVRKLAKKYDDFPQLRNGNRRLFIKEEVVDWLKTNSTAGIRV